MKFETTRFGQINVEENDTIRLPEGPLGFPDCTRFTLIDEETSYPFRMLQSLDNASLAFVVVDPLIARPEYHFNVTKEELKFVKADSTDGLMVYVIVTMAADIKEVTVNLQGPLVINPISKLGHQFVLVNTDYSTREKLLNNETIEQVDRDKADPTNIVTDTPKKKVI